MIKGGQLGVTAMRTIAWICIASLTLFASPALAKKRTLDGDVRLIHDLAKKTATGCIDLDDHGVRVVLCTREAEGGIEITMKTGVRTFSDVGRSCTHLEVSYITGSRDSYVSREICPEGAPRIGSQAWEIFQETLWLMVNMLRAAEQST